MTISPKMELALIAPARVALADYASAMALGGGGRQVPKAAMSISDGDGTRRLYPVHAGIAIIAVSGVLLPKFCYVGWSFATGYDALQCQFAQAFADPDVKAIVLDIDSGGGAVSGCFDLVDWIASAKSAAKKPVVAILSESACSAAYAIASVADSISVPRTGYIGSVGVVMLHADFSKMYEDFGITLTYIHAGAHKVDGNPVTPLPDDVRDTWQAECEDIRKLFCDTVARGRQAAGTKITAKDLLATEARVYSGPAGVAQAITLGLADAMLAPSEAFAQLVQAVSSDAA